MKIKFYIFITLFIVSCGGGGGGSSGDSSGGSSAPLNPMINTFSSTASSVSINTSVTLNWTTTNTNSCSASGDWSGTKSLNGSEDITLDEAKTYSFTLTCSGASGTSNATSTLTVEVSSVDGSDIYGEDKASYCKDPLNDSSNYWLENFDSDVFDSCRASRMF